MPVTEHQSVQEDDPKITSSSSSSPSSSDPSSHSHPSSDSSASNLTRTDSTNKDEDDDTNVNINETTNPDTFLDSQHPTILSNNHAFPHYPSSNLLSRFNVQDYTEGSASPVSDIISMDNYYENTNTLINNNLDTITTNSSHTTPSHDPSSYRFTQKSTSSFSLSPTLYTNITKHKLDYFNTFRPTTSHHHHNHTRRSSRTSHSSTTSTSDYIDHNHIPKLLNTYLRPNAQFIGEQQSGKSRFHIKVEFKTVDLLNSIVTGFLQISGLTEDHSEIITCFKGEIINNPLNKYNWKNDCQSSNHKHPLQQEQVIRNYSFITENKQWGSYMKNDFEHWKKLINLNDLDDDQLMKRLINIQNGDEDNQFIYMRWKEEFLLPDSRIKQISGASFDGFYYIVLNIGSNELFHIHDSSTNNDNANVAAHTNTIAANAYNCMIPGSISGLYYHKTSEKFQSLSLRYIDDHGASGSFQFA